MNLLSLQWWNAVSDLVIWTVIWVACLVWLYQGGHALAMRSCARPVALRAIAGGFVCIGLGAMNYWVSTTMEHLSALSNQLPRVTKQLPDDWGAGDPPEEREKSSRIIASMAYVDSGRLFKYVDRAGVWKEYSPTSEDASRIRERTESIVRTSMQAADSLDSAIRTWVAGFVAFVLGLTIGYLGRKKGANPSINTDAAR